MNKIYKVIWNESLETYVAVAEIENSHSSSSRRTRVRALLNTIVFTPVMSVMAVAVVGTLTTPQQAHAAYAADGGVNNGGTVAIGAGAVADGTRSIALGGDAKTKGTHTVKVKGVDKVYTTPDGNNQAIAIGYESYAYGSQAVGLGANVRAVGNSSIAIGGDDLNAAAGTSNNSDTAKAYKDITGDNLVRAYDGKTGATNQYFGTSAGHAAVAIGVQAGSMGDLSTAFGTRTQADGLAATALGVGATANKDGSIALGAGSQTSTDAVKVTQAEIGGILFDNFTGTNAFAGTIYDTGRQVSIGSAGKERQIKHVAPGQLTQTSTDAINGSQLYAVAMKLSNVKDTAEKGWYVNSVFAGGALTATGPEKMSPGDTLTFSVGENLELDQIRGTIALRVAKNVQFDSVTTGDSVLNSTGLNIASSKGNTVSITNDGINLGNQVINGVSEGLVSGQSKQAVNGSQLYAANQNIANSLGGNAGVDATTGALTAPNYQVTNAAGDAVVYTDAAGNTLATAAGNVGDALTQMNTYVNTGFDVQQAGTTKGTVTPGDKINFVNGTLTTAKVTTEANGVTDITFDVNAQSVVDAAQLPVVYTNANGDRVYKQSNGDWNTQADGTGTVVNAGDVMASMSNADGQTTTPMVLGNVAAGEVSGSSTDAVNGSQLYAANQNIANSLGGNAGVDATTGVLTAPNYQVTNAAGDAVVYTDAAGNTLATAAGNVGDALTQMNTYVNTGFDVQQAGTTKGTVTPGDKINFVNGTLTTAKVTTEANGVTDITFDVNAQSVVDAAQLPVVYTNANGDRVYKQSNGDWNTKADGTGTVVNAGNVMASMSNADGQTTTPMVLGNVAAGEVSGSSTDAVNGSQLYAANQNIANSLGGNAGVDATTGALTAPNYQVTNAAGDAVVYTDAAGNTLATAAGNVGDALTQMNTYVNTGFDVQQAGTTKGTVTPGDKINFVNGTLTTAKVTTEANGVTDITFDVNAQSVVDAAQLPVVYTNANGDRVYKQSNGDWNTKADGTGTVVNAGDVMASMSNADGQTTTPMVLGNVAAGEVSGSSTDAVNGSQLYAANQNIANSLGGNAGVDATTGALTAPNYQVTNAAGDAVVYTDAAGNTLATAAGNVGDALTQMNTYVNTGFDVQQAGTTKGTVTLGDKINFVNGTLTTAKVTTEANGVTDITFDVNAQSVVDAAQLPVVYTNANGDRVYKQSNGDWNTKADGTGTVVNAGNVMASMSNADGQTTTPMVLGNVAAGEVSGSSTDAVNGSQLYAANQNIANSLGGNAGVDATTGALTAPNYQVTNAAGDAVVYTDAAGNTLATAAGNVGDALTQMNTYVNTGFDVQQAGTTKGTVTPGDKINFVNGTLTTAKVTTEANGVTDITFDVNAQSVVDAAQLPVVYTNANGDRVYKQSNGDWNTKADGTGTVVNAGDVMASMSNADGQTTTPMVLGNVAAGEVSGSSTDAVNGSQLYAANQNIANSLGGNAGVDATTGALTAPNYQVTNAVGDAVVYTDAAGNTLATAAGNVGDALTQMNTYVNTGFDVQQAGTTKGTVTPGDKINFVNGTLTTAKVTTEANGVTDITFDVNAQSVVDAAQLPVVYTNANGDRVYKQSNGDWNTKADGTGTVVNAGNVMASMSNADGQTTTPMVLGNVAAGEVSGSSTDAVNGSQLYAANQNIANSLGGNAGVDATTGALTAPNYQVTNAAGDAVVYTDAAGNTLATAAGNVGDALTQMNTYVNTGFDVQQAGTTKGTVTPGDKINFVNGTLTTAKVTTEANGVTDITFDVNAQSVVDAAQLPVVYTNANGDRVYKQSNGDWNTKADGTGTVVNAGDVMASMSNADGQTTTPMVLGNVAAGEVSGSSTDAVNGSQLYAANQNIANSLGGNAGVDATTGALTAPNYQVTNAAGDAVVYTDAAGNTLATAAGNVGDALTQMNTYVNTGFDVQQAGTTKGTVTPGDKINFVNGTLTTANVKTEANGVTDITFDVNAQSVVDAAQLPVVYTNANGDRVYKQSNGDWNTKADGTGTVVNAGDVMASMSNADSQTTTPMVLGNVAAGEVSGSSTDAVNGSQLYAANQNIANSLGGNAGVDATTGVLTAPNYQVTNAAGDAVVYTDAAGNTLATAAGNVGDALTQMNTYVNTGFDVQQAGTTKGTVTPGDKINFVNGTLTTAKVTTEANGVTDITFDVNAQSVVDAAQLPVVYTNANGDRVYKQSNGDWNTKADGTGTVVNAGDVMASMSNADGQTTTPMVLGNVAAGEVSGSSTDAVNGSQLYAANQNIANSLGGNAGVDATTGALTAPNYQVTNAAGDAVVYTDAAGNTLATAAGNVGDALTQMNTYVNTGFDVQQAGTTKGTVTPGDKINFVNGTLTTAKVTTEANGVTDITFDVNAQSVVDAAQLPVVYTNANGDRVYKQSNGDWNTKADGTGTVVNAGDVMASMSNADSQTTTPMVLGNVAAGEVSGSSTDAVNGSQLYAANQNIANSLGGNAGVDATTGALTAPNYQVTNAAGDAVVYTDAAGNTLATAAGNVGDALTQMNTYVNTGFDVQQAGTTKGTVTPGDKINFVNGTLTTAKVTTEANGVTDITFDVNAQSVVDAAQLPVVYTNANGDRVYKQSNGDWNTKADGTGTVVNAGNVMASMSNADGQTTTPMVLGNVAAGVISGSSTDAVNGSQLYAANQNIANSLGGNAGVDATTGALTAPNYQVTNAVGDAVVYTDAAGNTLATAAGNVGDALTQMNTYVNTGFDVQQAGTTKGTVTPGDKINFVNGTLTTAKVTTEANGVTDITFDVNAQSVVDAAQLPVVYTNANGDRVYKQSNGDWNTKADGTGTVVNAGNVMASMSNADGQTTTPMVLGNVAAGEVSGSSTDAVNGSQLYAANQNIANSLGGNAGVDATTGALTAPNYQVTNAAGDAVVYTDAAGNTLATAAGNVGDALTQMNTYVNTGFDVQQAGTTKGTVTPGDKINFVNGTLTTAKVTTEANGVTDITFDVNAQSVVDAAQLPVVYTNANGDRVYKQSNGDWNTKADGTGTVVNAGDVMASMSNADGQTTTPMVLGNVAAGEVSGSSTDAVNGSQLYAANQNIANSLGGNAGVDATTGALTAPNYQVTNAAGDAVVYTDAAGNTLATAAGNVGDALTQMNTYVNTGFDVQQAGTTKGTVTPGDKINFVNGTLTTANVKTEANGVTDITFDVNAQSVVDAAQLPVVYTNANGDRVYKQSNGDWNTKADGTGTVVNAGDVMASMSNADSQTTTPMVLGNVAAGEVSGSSTDAVNGSQLYAANQNIANSLGGNAGVDATTGALTAPNYQVTNAAGDAVVYTDAAGNTLATAAGNVGDALTQMNTYVNTGFDVQQAGTTKGTVTPGDKINFVNGTLTTAKVTTEANGVTDITFDVNAQSVVDAAQLPVVYTNANGDRVYKQSNGDWNTQADGSGNVVNAGNVMASMSNADGQTTTPMVLGNVAAGVISGSSTDAVNGSQLYAVGNSTASSLGGGSTFNTTTGKVEASLAVNGNTYNNVQDALNDLNGQVTSGWNLSTNGGAAHNVGPNGQVDLSNTDQNMVISNNNGNVTFDLSKNIQVDSVTSGDTLSDTYSQFTQAGFEVKTAQGNTLLNQDGLSFNDAAGLPTGPVISSNGINAGNLLITNVAAGSIAADSRDAVNGSQIHDLVGAGAYQDVNGKATPNIQNIGGTGATNIHDAFQALNTQTQAAKTEVVQGDNITVTQTVGAAGQDVYTVATKKDLVLDSVKIDDGQGQALTLNKTGTTVSNGSQSAHYGADGLVAKDAATGNQTVVNQDGLSFKDGNGN
ncbi:ESPR-type extended signal peptide-containing protein [Vitreoscilla stercoraria]|uniref:Uncharacterized protein n=2 Tax=Vitreoscilla stercoraria TaxID=61 RepID=A0ABY4E8H2_VITST|nr:ESPR-type extended signal peptide-containing protein [Vitreoscilla stercoraria]UOO92056.1 hypothetical protein LVJ81_10550 [Vitreoscilla stercoraria]